MSFNQTFLKQIKHCTFSKIKVDYVNKTGLQNTAQFGGLNTALNMKIKRCRSAEAVL